MTIVYRWRAFRRVDRRTITRQFSASPSDCVPKCSLSKYRFRASGVRTTASAHRAETGLLPRFLSSVPKRPSQEVRRERASRERFSAFSAPGQSTGLSRKPQETCHSARRPVGRRVRLVWELADGVGFEPTRRFHVYTLSRRAPSTTRPPVPRCLHPLPDLGRDTTPPLRPAASHRSRFLGPGWDLQPRAAPGRVEPLRGSADRSKPL